MKKLKQFLLLKGINKLDTDTAINNSIAQHYYLKNDFKKEDITRSFILKNYNNT